MKFLSRNKFEVTTGESTEAIDKSTEPRQLIQYAGACSACLSAFAIGNVLAWTSPAGPKLMSGEMGFPVNEYQNSWIGGLMPIGAAVSCIPTGYFTDKIGRKRTMLGLVPPFLVGWILIIWPNSVTMLYVGRFLCGMCGGAVCVTAPVFTAEICQKEIRGALGSYYQLLLAGGIMFTYIIGSFVSVFWLSIICALFPIFFGISFLFFPDTPVYYLTKGQPEEARKSLRFFRGPDYDIEPELCELAEASERGSSTDQSAWMAYTSRQAIRSLFMSVGMMIFQQLSGVNAIIFYTTAIFKAAGSSLEPEYSTILVGLMEFLATFLVMFIIDSLGRRLLLAFSAAAMALSLLMLGVYFHLKVHGQEVHHISWLPLICLSAFIVAHCLGYGPVPWTLIPEILPPRIKGRCCSIACSVNWLCAFIVTKFFSNMVQTFGHSGAFWIFTIISTIATVFSTMVLPETKGKSFQQIQKELRGSISSQTESSF